ncbi:unnamed protein product, partial [Musa hybrid cultivar]
GARVVFFLSSIACLLSTWLIRDECKRERRISIGGAKSKKARLLWLSKELGLVNLDPCKKTSEWGTGSGDKSKGLREGAFGGGNTGVGRGIYLGSDDVDWTSGYGHILGLSLVQPIQIKFSFLLRQKEEEEEEEFDTCFDT